MNRNRRIYFAKAAIILSVPVLLWAYNSGAPSRVTGAPGDQICLQSGCHVGPRTNDSPAIDIQWAGGQNYVPGQKQRFTVKLNFNARRFGFSASARLNSNLTNGQAGTFTAVDSSTYVLCDTVDPRPNNGCPANAPVEFITHTAPNSTGQFVFDWTPPASQTAGPVTIYFAMNGSNGPAPNGANIHLKSFTLQPGVTGSGVKPTISAGGVVSASAFGGGTTIAPGSWIEIFGKDLAQPGANRPWGGNDFIGSNAPTQLDNVKVTIGGKSAFVAYINPGQVNAQVPDGIPTGVNAVDVTVTTPGGTSDPIKLSGVPRAPGILAPFNFIVAGRQYVAALWPDSTTNSLIFACRPGSIQNVTCRLPKPGDRLLIYGVGFGAVSPSIAPGTIVSVANSIPGLTGLLGSAPIALEYAGLSPGLVGTYQFNIVVPNVQAGDLPITFSVDGVSTQKDVFLQVGN